MITIVRVKKGCNMKNIKRTVLVGTCLGIIFFGWILYAFYHQNWNFRLFSLSDWIFIGREFANGWVISSVSDWIFIISMLASVPVFIYLWRICCRVQWRKTTKTTYRGLKSVLSKSQNPKKTKKIKVKAKQSHKKVRPKPMVSTGRPPIKNVGKTMDAEKEENLQPSQTHAFEPKQPSFLDDSVANISLEDIQLPERIQLAEDLPTILSDANYQVIQDVTFNDFTFSFVGIAADSIVLCATDTEKGDWLADEEFFNDEEPLWFSESSHRISPVYRLSQATKLFTEKLTAAGFTQKVHSILIEKDGTIINAEDMINTWQKMDITVCRTDLGGPEELPGFAAAVPSATDKGSAVNFDAIHDLF